MEEIENKEIENKISELEDKYIRIYSDFENYKKRIIKEKEEIVINTKISMLSSILDVDNDINIAIKNIKDEESKEGVKLIANKITNFLKTHGIEEIQTNTYDEELHDVISVINNSKNEIVEVISKGYTLNGKPFRYPKIILGK